MVDEETEEVAVSKGDFGNDLEKMDSQVAQGLMAKAMMITDTHRVQEHQRRKLAVVRPSGMRLTYGMSDMHMQCTGTHGGSAVCVRRSVLNFPLGIRILVICS